MTRANLSLFFCRVIFGIQPLLLLLLVLVLGHVTIIMIVIIIVSPPN